MRSSPRGKRLPSPSRTRKFFCAPRSCRRPQSIAPRPFRGRTLSPFPTRRCGHARPRTCPIPLRASRCRPRRRGVGCGMLTPTRCSLASRRGRGTFRNARLFTQCYPTRTSLSSRYRPRRACTTKSSRKYKSTMDAMGRISKFILLRMSAHQGLLAGPPSKAM